MSNATSEATVDRLLKRVRQTLVAIEEGYRAQGRSVAELGIDELAERMAAVVPSPSPVNDRIGPFYRAEQVARLLGVTRQAVHERTKKEALLALRTADEKWVYPTFQFDGRRVVRGLAEVLAALRGADRWAVAGWCVSPTAGLAGMTPLEAARAGEDLRPVLDLARDARRRWAQ